MVRALTDAAERKAIAAGRITPEADGTIDTDRAGAEWARNTEAPRNGTRTRPVRAAILPQTQDSPVSSPAGSTSLLQARTVNEEKVDRSYVSRIINLTTLAPDI